jgi:hypothetical protein
MKRLRYEFDPQADLKLRLIEPNKQEQAATTLVVGDISSNSADISTPVDNPTEREIHMMVSSRHLKLASAYFQTMLNGPWKEALKSVDLNNPITASEWDERVFVIVMDIIHGHNREIP